MKFHSADKLSTYGFRGVALNALCALADISILTRTKNETFATIYSLDSNGKVKSTEPSHGKEGIFIIENIHNDTHIVWVHIKNKI